MLYTDGVIERRRESIDVGFDRLALVASDLADLEPADFVEALVEAMKPYSRHGVNVNVDFYAGVVYYLNGIPSDLFVPIFAIGRVPGWAVSVLEQFETNILIRPLTLYNGAAPRAYAPIGAR